MAGSLLLLAPQGEATMAVRKLTYEELCDLSQGKDFDFASTRSVASLREIVGQDRAVEALEFGLGIRSQGYNIFLAGYPGTGRRHVITRFLAERTPKEPPPDDWCYVHQFSRPDEPMALNLPAGRGPEFSDDVDKAVERIRHQLPKAFEGERYHRMRSDVLTRGRQKREKIQAVLNKELRQKGLMLQQTAMGIGIVPLGESGEAMSREQFEALPQDRQAAIRGQQESVQSSLEQTMRQLRQLDTEQRDQMQKIDEDVARQLVEEILRDLCGKYDKQKRICAYLRGMMDDIVRNHAAFRAGGDEDDDTPAAAQALGAARAEAQFGRYKVNVFVTNDPDDGAPVVYEANPTHPNLFGRVERRYAMGALITDFTMLKAGAAHKANGGYLIVDAIDVLMRPGAWDALKRAIESRELRLEDLGQALGYAYSETLQPEPIPFNAKIVLVGNPMIYQLLFSLDEHFHDLFKVKAEFAVDMDRSDTSLRQLAMFVARQIEEHKLLPMDAAAVAAVANHASRLIEDREKLSTQFVRITDVLCESDHWARQGKARTIAARHVEKAIEARRRRSNLVEERLRESVDRGTLMIDTRGRRVGQVNGLVVYQLGDHQFGMPSRVTANVHLGSAGVVNIERRADLSGSIHTKGVEILSGLLGERFCQDRPLSLSATLTFEQSYGGVEGDSASGAEYYALLSALADAPINQSIAVTGSINQKGDSQPIGGATSKVEGFYDICRLKGLTGKQGCILPAANLQNLVLRKDVLEAVGKGRFHLWAIETVDDGVELLMGAPAGKRSKRGTWTPGSIGARVDERLAGYAEKAKSYNDKVGNGRKKNSNRDSHKKK
jgi:predicted ATP-dependent protease